MIHVGLTGGVASGKSAVAARLVELGAVLIDADKLAREVVAPGTPGLEAIRTAFGEGVFSADGSLDRAALGALVFGDEAQRRKLNAIVHPLVRARAQELRAAAGQQAIVVEDIPLLAESGQAQDFDTVIVVQAPRAERIRRMIEDRGWTRADAESRMAAQASDAQRAQIADHLLHNEGTLEELRARVTELFEKELRR
ncbi:dephospho-CoA kinase [Arthrobacter sp. MYb224]|uniref:dephospho-CoA kinase n=1 Tax=unclassified Arthrobacter TaxID=235627 RepID=UPI000CFE0CA8|nr:MULTISPECIES: dephospho-CoA kinase [unclassified Arthrobacter]PRA01361.1 dephospho-CoA kinase [Arthrobacter sp. MYb224]PRA06447.1 dephospho-CoA kinase [Arthrobacter sp. MYb229]PRB53349.1 dephospho-CoA kinase [Arthrobacter sp. MYb216]